MNDIKDYLELFHSSNVYLPTMTIYISPKDDDSITDVETASNAIKNIHALDNIYRGKDDNAINIIMNNPGGNVDDGFQIYDAIAACKKYVRLYVYGKAQSMGSIIMQAADERVIAPHANIMIHEGSIAHPESNWKSVENWQKYNKKVDQDIFNIYLEKLQERDPSFHRNTLKSWLSCDTIFTAQEAVDYGLADRLVERGEFKDKL